MIEPPVLSIRGRLWRVSRFLFLLILVIGLLALGVSVASSSAPASGANRVQVSQSRAVFPLSQPALARVRKAYAPIPTISIVSVDKGNSVTIMTHNFPANQMFEVRMGAMFTRGINGTVVGSFDSGAGGSFEKSFDIPAAFKEAAQISIRTQTAHKHPYFSYNWFFNQGESGADDDSGNNSGNDDPVVGYKGIPTFKVCEVNRDSTVTIATSNLPPNQTFTVRMGAFGGAGIGGAVAGTFESGEGGALNVTIDIPAAVKGHGRIAIRAQTAHKHPYFAYNWFYNNTASVC